MQTGNSWKLLVLFIVGITALVVVVLMHPIAQDPRYHQFADRRTLLGIPNFWNVISNLPFLIVGISGLLGLRAGSLRGGLPAAGLLCRVFFWAVIFIAFGSAYYHWAPSNFRLVWDRLPMTAAFMAFFSIVIAEYVSAPAGRRLLPLLLLAGIFSVLYWYLGERHGHGDLRWYAVLQFLPMLLLPLVLLLFPPGLKPAVYLWAVLFAYALSKLAEYWDASILSWTGGQISGHSVKHLLAGLATYAFFLALRHRRPGPGTCQNS